MITLRNSDVYVNGQPFTASPTGRAINDILSQRIDSRLGMRIRKLLRQLETHAGDVNEEVKRILDQYIAGDDGAYGAADQKAINEQYGALMVDEFAIEGEPLMLKSLEGLNLQGWTWASPIVEEEEEAE